MTAMRKYLYLALFLISVLPLSGCVLFAAGAGAATSAAVLNDRRSLQTMTDDQNIEFTANSQLKQDKSLTAQSHIVVIAFNHAVLLVGQVPAETDRQHIETLVQSLPKVTRIYNELEIMPPSSPLVRSNDAWITAKVKSQMLATAKLNSGQIKVVTENSTVYLLGIVTHKQASLATDVARRVDGVKRVVTLFEYTLAV